MSGEAATAASPASPDVPWTGSDVAVVFLFLYLIWPALALSALLGSGFFHWYYGPGVVALVSESDDGLRRRQEVVGLAVGPGGARAVPLARDRARSRFTLWAVLLALPFQIATPLLLLGRLRGVTAEQLGLTTRRLGRNLLGGVLAWVILTPLVLGCHLLLVWLFSLWPGGTESHKLTLVAEQHLTVVEWSLWLGSALVAAPLLEEFLFRGLLQPFLAGDRRRPFGALVLALLYVFLVRGERFLAVRGDPLTLLAELLPVLCLLALFPILDLVERRSRTQAGPAIFATAVLFGFIHGAWPSPLALTLLGLGLGWLAWRTRSLAGPILLHALFNGVSAVQLLWQ